MTPVPVGDTPNATAPGQGSNNGGQVYGPFAIGGKLYSACQTGSFPTYSVDMFVSTDNGQSWNSVALGGSGNTTGNFAAASNGTLIRVFWAGTFSPPSYTNIKYADFDPVSGSWSGVTSGGPNTNIVLGAHYTANGSWFVICTRKTQIPLNPQDPLRFAILKGGWTDGDLSTNAFTEFGLQGNDPAIDCCTSLSVDGSIIHTTFSWLEQTAPFPTNHTIYQAVSQTGVLGTYVSFTDLVQGWPLPPQIFEYGDHVVLSYARITDQSQCIAVGTPAASPVFVTNISVDPGYPTDSNLIGGYNGALLEVAGVLQLCYVCKSIDGTNNNRLRMLATSNDIDPSFGWSASTLFDGSSDGGPGWVQGQLISPGIITDTSIVFNSPSIVDGSIIQYAFGSGVIPSTPAQGFLNATRYPVISLPNPAGRC